MQQANHATGKLVDRAGKYQIVPPKCSGIQLV